MSTSSNIVWHHASVTRERRQKQSRHRSLAIWFTGYSGSGKSTIAHAVEERLHASGMRTIVLDGDNVRHGLCADLGFSERDRSENLRRIGEMGKLFLEAGVVALMAFISPLRSDRERIRSMYRTDDFFEIFVDCPLEVCERRDVKGMYRRARAGEIKEFTGISAPYEPPEAPDLTLRSDLLSLEECVSRVVSLANRVSRLDDGEKNDA